MNLRLGRFGKQESACVCGLGALMSGMFAVNTAEAYAEGNVCWLATLLGLLGAVLVFLLLIKAMEKQRVSSLGALFQRTLGRIGGTVLGLGVTGVLVFSAALPNLQMLFAMDRYVFEGADYPVIAAYQLGAVVLLCVLGMEGIARTGRLLLLPAVAGVGLAVFLASPAFGWHHLFPLLGAGMEALLLQSLQALLRFLPPVLALCAVGEGCQGQNCLKESGLIGLWSGGLGAVLMQLVLGLSCYSWDISRLSVPMYRMTMATRYDAVTVRLDVTVLFLWVVCALGTGAYYVYAGSLLFCKSTGLQDIRPVGAGLSGLSLGLMLLLHLDGGRPEDLGAWLYQWGWAPAAVPAVLGGLLGLAGRDPYKKAGETSA